MIEMIININGRFCKASEAIISPFDRSFRYGDGCFETMQLRQGKILLPHLHFNRLYASLERLQMDLEDEFTPGILEKLILQTAEKNNLIDARVRLTLSRGQGSLYEQNPGSFLFIIETHPLSNSNQQLNETGLKLGVYRDSVKAADQFSWIKSGSFLPYAMAAKWVQKSHLDDAVLLNQFGRVADTTIANIFILKNGSIITPALTEGCISGVMRQHLLGQLRKDDFPVAETSITLDDLEGAHEVFVTNAIRGIQWVASIGTNNYTSNLTIELHRRYITPLFND